MNEHLEILKTFPDRALSITKSIINIAGSIGDIASGEAILVPVSREIVDELNNPIPQHDTARTRHTKLTRPHGSRRRISSNV